MKQISDGIKGAGNYSNLGVTSRASQIYHKHGNAVTINIGNHDNRCVIWSHSHSNNGIKLYWAMYEVHIGTEKGHVYG